MSVFNEQNVQKLSQHIPVYFDILINTIYVEFCSYFLCKFSLQLDYLTFHYQKEIKLGVLTLGVSFTNILTKRLHNDVTDFMTTHHF